MKKKIITILLGALALCLAGIAPAQENPVDRVTVQLTDPGKPASLSVGLVNGGITVTGYDGKEVIVETRTNIKKWKEFEEQDKDQDKNSGGNGKKSGLTKINVNSSSFSVVEYKNVIEIATDSWANAIDLVIKVPKNTSLSLSCINDGDIEVENITGEIEVSNINGAVTLLNVTGSVIASAHNKDLTVEFAGIDPDKDMSFSSFNGDVDVTFPASLKAVVKLKTTRGDIYTDFDVKETENADRVVKKNERSSGGKYQVSVDRSFWGTINGGGQEIQFSNFNGDIYIRKHK
jgi:DUF4097 and DUF4098 domain-containing protein YvlB